jgi:hypothetical protein
MNIMSIKISIINLRTIIIVSVFSLYGIATAQYKTESVTSEQDIPIFKPWKIVVQDKDYNGAWTVAGDINDDGIPEFVCARTLGLEGEHYTASVIAYTLDNKVLWKWGNPKGQRESLGSDVACQIYDWDNDGKNEVILCALQDGKTWLIELYGATGKEKRRFEIPAGASDCITFCNISGPPFAYPRDVIVKNRYNQLWAYDHEGHKLWTQYRPGKYSIAHQPVPFDLDQDGIDEIMTGYVMVDAKGNPMWIANRDGTSSAGHLDCARLYQQGSAYIVDKVLHPSPSWSKLVLTYCSGRRISMIDGGGNLIWGISGRHFESIDIGKVRSDVDGKQIIVDAASDEQNENGVWILDGNGNKLKIISTFKGRFHRLIDWFGNPDIESIVIPDERAIFDGYGKKLAILDTPIPKGVETPLKDLEYIGFTGEMTGDSIPDIVLYTNPGSLIYVYKNEKGKIPPGKVVKGTGVNYTLY